MPFHLFRRKQKNRSLELIHIGGQDEIGKNMTLLKFGGNILIIDCGLKFPDENAPGVDKIYPDISYVLSHKDQVRGVILTHGHEDHIGAVPYLLSKINLPVYGTKLTLGLLEKRIKEFNLHKQPKLNVVAPKSRISIGPFVVEPIRVCHSIPDAVSYVIKTPVGQIVHTGDIKIDYSPIDNLPIDLARFSELGREGVLLLISDSTNAEEEGHTPSESTVARFFEKFLNYKEGRIIIASFASNIHRIQQIFDFSLKYGKKVAISGMSMENVVRKAKDLGYLHFDNSILVKLNDVSKISPNKLVIITTGSQGEPMAALSRMAKKEHKQINIQPTDRVIISASPIPGNEVAINKTINNLAKLGAQVIYEEKHGLHVSGHAASEDLRLIIKIIKPKFFVPTHGEYKQLLAHVDIAKQCGIRGDHIFLNENGDRLIITKERIVKGAKISISNVYVDGSGIGDITEEVLNERRKIGENGLIVVNTLVSKSDFRIISNPEFRTHGFVFAVADENLLKKSNDLVKNVILRYYRQRVKNLQHVNNEIERELQRLIYKKTERMPVVISIINQV